MTRLPCPTVLAGFLGGTLLLAGCAGSASQSRATAAQRAACSQRADQVFEQQNRGAIYEADTYATSTRDAPLSAAGLIGSTTGLSNQYVRDKIESDCIDGINGAPAPDDAAAAPVTKPADGAAPATK